MFIFNRRSKSQTDAELLHKLKQGDERAVETWFSTYKPKLLGYVQTKVSSPKDAEELVQETFLNCLKHLPLFQGKSSIWTWMCSVARHEIADYYRKRYAKKALQTIPLFDQLLSELAIHDAHETAELVRETMSKLEPQTRDLLQFKYLDELSVKEIAAKLGRTAKAVESDLYRARNDFKAIYLRLEQI